jgi:hypothetical protein
MAEDGVDFALDRALQDLAAAGPLGQAAALIRLAELQAALLRDVRNRLAALEGNPVNRARTEE